MTSVKHIKERPRGALLSGPRIQASVADGSATRESSLHSEEVARLGSQYRVFSGLRLDAARKELALADHENGAVLRSPVDGLRMTIKGNIPHRDLYWTEGTTCYRKRRSQVTATSVERLEAAGAVVVGTTTLTELAMYAPDNPMEPVAINPWAPSRTPGGSSSGAGAAAILGLAEINLGTDAGGSIRNPALHCGVFGFKPSLDRWDIGGVTRYAPSLDTLGVICRSVDDIIATDGVLTGRRDVRSPFSALRLRVPEHLLSDYCDRETRSIFDGIVAQLIAAGVAVAPVSLENWERGEVSAGVLSRFQAARSIGPDLREKLSPRLAERLAIGDTVSEREADDAQRGCDALAWELAALLEDGDVVLTPTWPFRAPHCHQTHVVVQAKRRTVEPSRNIFVRAANAAKAPALSLPSGWYPGGVPFGLHLMSEEGADARVLDAGRLVAEIIPHCLDGRPMFQ